MARHSVELGWTNITPCSEIVSVPTSIPGVSLPTLKTAEQRLFAFADVDSDGMRDDAMGALRDCAIASVGAAGGIGALTANPAAAAAAFKAALIACFATKFSDIAINNVELRTKTECMW